MIVTTILRHVPSDIGETGFPQKFGELLTEQSPIRRAITLRLPPRAVGPQDELIGVIGFTILCPFPDLEFAVVEHARERAGLGFENESVVIPDCRYKEAAFGRLSVKAARVASKAVNVIT